eukprot:11556191-Karenia_brevis.AAC.1
MLLERKTGGSRIQAAECSEMPTATKALRVGPPSEGMKWTTKDQSIGCWNDTPACMTANCLTTLTISAAGAFHR